MTGALSGGPSTPTHSHHRQSWDSDNGWSSSGKSSADEQQQQAAFAAATAVLHEQQRRLWDETRRGHQRVAADAKAALQRNWLKRTANCLVVKYKQYSITGPLYLLSPGEAAIYHLLTLLALWTLWRLVIRAANAAGLAVVGTNGNPLVLRH